jgi:hypothetical protein
MEVRSDPFEPAKSHLFDTSSWGDFCDVTLTLKQGHQPHSGGWVKTDDYRCRHAFRHFMNLLNRAAYGSAFRRHGKRLRVLPVLEKGEVRARGLRSWERGPHRRSLRSPELHRRPRTGISQKRNPAPPATSPSCGLKPLHHLGGPSRSRCAAPDCRPPPAKG